MPFGLAVESLSCGAKANSDAARPPDWSPISAYSETLIAIFAALTWSRCAGTIAFQKQVVSVWHSEYV
jgi:hypothetical protein